MPLRLTNPLLDRLTPSLREKIERAYAQFPELQAQAVIVGLTRKRRLDGYAIGEDFCIRLNIRRRKGVSYFTIGHELTHLLQKPGLGIVPDGEVQCDIWTLARSELFLDELPTYLDVSPCAEHEWEHHARLVRQLCVRAIEVRQTNRRYIVWLKQRLREHFGGPGQLPLWDPVAPGWLSSTSASSIRADQPGPNLGSVG